MSGIEQRPLGRTGLVVSSLGMGCARLGAVWQGRSNRDGRQAVSLALSAGINFFDTSDVYGRGLSERLVGSALRGVREEIVIATKCGLIRTPSTFWNAASSVWSGPDGKRRLSSMSGMLKTRRRYAREYIARAAIASLRRLKTDRLDLLLLHSPPREVLLDIEIADEMAHLRQEGTIRFWGVSARNDDEALIALDMPGIDCLEIQFNVCHRRPSTDVIPKAASGGVGVIAREPFASGRLVSGPLPSGTTMETAVAACLQFAISVPGLATVIPGMSRPRHVARNVAAMDIPVTESALREIRFHCPEK